MRCFLLNQTVTHCFLFSSKSDVLQDFFSKSIFYEKHENRKLYRFHGLKKKKLDLCVQFFLESEMPKHLKFKIWFVFFTTMYNICLVKKFFQSLLRCIFPIRHLNSSKILFQTLTLCVFFLNFKIWRVVSFNSKSDALCFSSVQNLTLCKIFNSKSDKL